MPTHLFESQTAGKEHFSKWISEAATLAYSVTGKLLSEGLLQGVTIITVEDVCVAASQAMPHTLPTGTCPLCRIIFYKQQVNKM